MTMSTYFDASGKTVSLGAKLGAGGEGAVFEVAGQPDRVAKIYHSPLTREKADKIETTAQIQSASLRKMTAWPEGLLFSGGRVGVGLLMPKVAGYKDIHNLYSPKSRRVEFQNADFIFLVHAAANMATAFLSVHEAGCVIGDVNHGGVTVAENATVKLIDCDSFQISNCGKTYHCDVGVSTFIPPELQGRSLRNTSFALKSHDNFGLAILIFHLLVMGRHPFAGRYLGRGDMPMETAIQQYRYAYGANGAKHQMQPPPNVPALKSISTGVADLFEKAFSQDAITAGRPEPRTWLTTLESLSKNLARCSVNPYHAFAVGSGSCPWCQIEAVTGILLFNVALVQTPGAQIDINSLLRSIEALRLISLPSAPREQDIPTPAPTAEAVQLAEKEKAKKSKLPFFITIIVSLTVGLILVAPSLATIWMIGGYILYVFVKHRIRSTGAIQQSDSELLAAETAAQDARRQYSEFTARQFGQAGSFASKKKQLETHKAAWNALPERRTKSLKMLEQNRHKQQLDKFLSNFFIDHASISGIGPGRKATLSSYGIQTAADVDPKRLLAVPGFGPHLSKKLLDWRRKMERGFTFDPSKGIELHQIAVLDQEIEKEKRKVHNALIQGLNELTQSKKQLELQYSVIRGQLEGSLLALAQARANRGAFS